MYEGSSFVEMYEDFQREAVKRIAKIMLYAYNYHFWPGPFKPNPDVYGLWIPNLSARGYGRRDFWDMCKIRFSPIMRFIKDDKKIGTPVPLGAQKNVQAVLLERTRPLSVGFSQIVNNEGQVRILQEYEFPPVGYRPATLPEILKDTQAYTDKTYEVGSSSEHVKTIGSLFGWDFENSIESKTTIGNDTTPAKQEITIGVKWGLKGEKTKGSSDALGETTMNSTTDHVPLPLGYKTSLVQTQKTGTIEIPVTHNMIFDLVFDVELYSGAVRTDFHKRGSDNNRRTFSDSPDNDWTHRAKHSEMRALRVLSADDFRLTMKGKNRRYPRVPANSFNTWRWIRDSYNWLIDEANRTGIVRVKDVYKNGFFDEGKLTHEPIQDVA